MTFKLNFKPDENYYVEAYEELICLKKMKKIEPILATISAIFGIWLLYSDKNNVLGYFPFLFILMGIYEFFKFYYEKKKWIKERNSSGIIGQEIELEFSDEFIKHSGPFSNGELKWSGLKSISETKKGIVIKPENGLNIYLPYLLFESKEQIEFIIQKKATL